MVLKDETSRLGSTQSATGDEHRASTNSTVINDTCKPKRTSSGLYAQT